MKTIIIIILFSYSISGFAVKWEKITEGYDGNSIYVDIDSIEKKESRVYYSNLIDFLEPKQKSYSVVSKFKVDCGEEQMSWLSTTYFSQPMGKGEIVSKSTVKQIRLPQTDTLARAELLFVCR
mgnify:CR=1 FL=1